MYILRPESKWFVDLRIEKTILICSEHYLVVSDFPLYTDNLIDSSISFAIPN